MRDKPSFDDLEPPAVTPTPIDGLSDEQWAERRLRKERVVRIACGIALGCFLGMLSVWHWGLLHGRSRLPALMVLGGSVVLFASLFAQRRDDEALDYAGWIAFPEWKIFESLPWWVIAMIFSIALATLMVLATVVFIGHFPFIGR
jgi:hypothetical protein